MSGLIIDRNQASNQNDNLPNPPIDPKYDHWRHSNFKENFKLSWLINSTIKNCRIDSQFRIETAVQLKQKILDTKRYNSSYAKTIELPIKNHCKDV